MGFKDAIPEQVASFSRRIKFLKENQKMATRERRLAEFDGNGEPPPDLPVQVLCEDHSGTYQLPFACRFVDGAWRNHESGGAVEATVVGWRRQRAKA
jgi:hypothetical protein